MAQQLTINIEDMGIMSSLMRILSSIKGISLQPLSELQMERAAAKPQTATLQFPHIPKNRKPLPQVMEMVAGKLPADFDEYKERDAMWEELAR